MNKTQAISILVALAIILPSAAYSQLETSSHKIQGSTCVNLRAKPSIDAAVVNCLQPGSAITVSRIPPAGRFVWVKDQSGRTWYRASIPGTNAVGWIMPACTDIFGNTKTEACTDYGSIAQNPGTQGQTTIQSPSQSQFPSRQLPEAVRPPSNPQEQPSASQPSTTTPPPIETQPPTNSSAQPSSQPQSPPLTQPPSGTATKISSIAKSAKWWGLKGGIIYPDAKQACEDLASYWASPLDRFELFNFNQNGSPLNARCFFKNGRDEQTGVFCPTDGNYQYVGGSKGVCILSTFVEPVPPVKPALWKEFIVTLGDLQFATGIGLCNLAQRATSKAQKACNVLENVYEALRPDVDYGCSRCVEVADLVTDFLGKARLPRRMPLPLINLPSDQNQPSSSSNPASQHNGTQTQP